MQCDRTRHNKPRDKKLAERFLSFYLIIFLLMLVIVVAVDQFRQLIRRLRMFFANMPDLRIRLFVNNCIQQINKPEPGRSHCNDEENVFHRIRNLPERVLQQIEAYDTEHDAASKTQKQTDDFFGISCKQNADQSAQTGSDNPGDCCNDDNKNKSTHNYLFLFCLITIIISRQ